MIHTRKSQMRWKERKINETLTHTSTTIETVCDYNAIFSFASLHRLHRALVLRELERFHLNLKLFLNYNLHVICCIE